MKTFLYIRDMLILLLVASAMCAGTMALYWWILK
jgi:hypothetical protein